MKPFLHHRLPEPTGDAQCPNGQRKTPGSITSAEVSPGAPSAMRTPRRRSKAAFSMMEVVVAASLIVLVAVATTQAILVSNRYAAVNRILTAARTIVQRNLDNALTFRWDTTAGEPPILALTSSSGSPYDETNPTGTSGAVNILIEKANDGTTFGAVPGTLTRTVTAVTNPQNADIRTVTFTLTFVYRNRNYNVSMTTIRTRDD